MKLRIIFVWVIAFALSISGASASGLLGEKDLLGDSGKGCGTVISFGTSRASAQAAKPEKVAQKTEANDTPLSEKEVCPAKQKTDENTPSGDTFAFLQPGTAYFLLIMLAFTIIRLVK